MTVKISRFSDTFWSLVSPLEVRRYFAKLQKLFFQKIQLFTKMALEPRVLIPTRSMIRQIKGMITGVNPKENI